MYGGVAGEAGQPVPLCRSGGAGALFRIGRLGLSHFGPAESRYRDSPRYRRLHAGFARGTDLRLRSGQAASVPTFALGVAVAGQPRRLSLRGLPHKNPL